MRISNVAAEQQRGRLRPPCMRAVGDDNNNGSMCSPYAHGGSELRKNTTDGSVLADVLFVNGDVHDGNPTLSA